MNTEKLKVLIPILQKTDPSEFSMGNVVGWNWKEQKANYCLIGLLYRDHHPNIGGSGFGYMEGVEYMHKYLETNHTEGRYVWDNKSYFLFGGQWSVRPELDTIDHALKRIDLILQGYEPKDIWKEVVAECTRLNLEPVSKWF